jgi:hypothetical protein
MKHGGWLLVFVTAGALVRIVLLRAPEIWYDEATIGLMGLAVLRGDFPLYFYGQIRGRRPSKQKSKTSTQSHRRDLLPQPSSRRSGHGLSRPGDVFRARRFGRGRCAPKRLESVSAAATTAAEIARSRG